VKEKLAKLQSEMQRLAAMENLMPASPDQQISLTDPGSRSMATSGLGSGVVGYTDGSLQAALRDKGSPHEMFETVWFSSSGLEVANNLFCRGTRH
jgi:hypothetical protein